MPEAAERRAAVLWRKADAAGQPTAARAPIPLCGRGIAADRTGDDGQPRAPGLSGPAQRKSRSGADGGAPSIAAGRPISGQMTYPGYEHLRFDGVVEQMVPESFFSFRWQPGADPKPGEPETLVEFTLEEVPGGTRLTLAESGFDRFPPERRAQVVRDNDGGWDEQMGNIGRHVSR